MADESVKRMADEAKDRTEETVTRETEKVSAPASGERSVERESESVSRERESSESKK